jgi:hypothetical protein
MSEETKFKAITDNLGTNVRIRPKVDEWAMKGIMAKREEILTAFRQEAGCEPSEAILTVTRTKHGIRMAYLRQRASDHIKEFLAKEVEEAGMSEENLTIDRDE